MHLVHGPLSTARHTVTIRSVFTKRLMALVSIVCPLPPFERARVMMLRVTGAASLVLVLSYLEVPVSLTEDSVYTFFFCDSTLVCPYLAYRHMSP